jgi:two-component system, NarL family, nitrate/nitrite response regulator NarL
MEPKQGSNQDVIRVLVADSTHIHTQLLADALKRDPKLDVLGVHSTDLIPTAIHHNIDVAVVSSNLDEDPLRGFEVLRKLRAAVPKIRTIVLLDSSKREVILAAFQAGAKGVFSRYESLETLCQCVRQVHAGQIWANSQQMSYAVEALAATPTVRAVDANGLSLLSKRELEVVRSLAEGLTNREIAERLGLSQHTIKNYLFRVFDKLGVSSRMELLCLTLTQPNEQARENVSGGTAGAGKRNDADNPDLAWHKKAAEEGMPDAQIALAQMYAQGKHAEKDPVAAYAWYLVSEQTMAEMKDLISNSKRKLAESLSTEEILEAQKAAAARLKKSVKPASHDSKDVVATAKHVLA